MAIPKLEVVTFELTLPSNGKKVKYRPFLVKEHKALLMTDTEDKVEVSRVVEEIVDVCTFKQLNMRQLAIFDIEYLFMNIRAKSIGEVVDLIVTCKCETQYPHKMNIANVNLEKSDAHKNKFMISDKVGIEMKYPRLFDINAALNGSYDDLVNLLMHTIKAVYTAQGEYHEVTIDDKEDLLQFISALTVKQFEQIEEFFKTMPKLRYKALTECPQCKVMSNLVVEGLQNFFV